MAQSDGEKELVLGNKQLISLFFVMVALCGVFFAMGYMIGRNTSKSVISSLEGIVPAAPVPQPAASQSQVAPAQDPETPRETPPEDTQPPGPAPPASAQTASLQNASTQGAAAQGASIQTQ